MTIRRRQLSYEGTLSDILDNQKSTPKKIRIKKPLVLAKSPDEKMRAK